MILVPEQSHCARRNLGFRKQRVESKRHSHLLPFKRQHPNRDLPTVHHWANVGEWCGPPRQADWRIRSGSRMSCTAARLADRLRKWVNRCRSLPAENLSMSAMPPIATKFCRVAKCREGPCMDGARGARRNLTYLRSVRVQPCIRPVFEWRADLHCDAAAMVAGPDVIR